MPGSPRHGQILRTVVKANKLFFLSRCGKLSAHPFDLSASLIDPHQAPAQDSTPQPCIFPIDDTLKILYVPSTTLGQLLKDAHRHVLCLKRFGAQSSMDVPFHEFFIHVAMPQRGEMELVEVWLSPTPVSFDKTHNMRIAANGEMLLGCWEREESREAELDHLVWQAYEQILTFCETAGYPNLFRMWNYFPAINTDQKGLERYNRFCVGRHKAFAERFTDLQSVLPAASAVGTQGGPIQIIFLAGKQPGTHIENPRQVSAYHYPRLYGPQSPSFARATLAGSPGTNRQLYLAGTASIVGHATCHVGEPIKQTRETLENIEKLLEAAAWNTSKAVGGDAGSSGLLKVYMRQASDYEKIQGVISTGKFQSFPAIFLIGDMCRKELLVEIEGIWSSGESGILQALEGGRLKKSQVSSKGALAK